MIDNPLTDCRRNLPRIPAPLCRLIWLLPALFILLTLPSCGKNAFSVEMELSGDAAASASSYRFLWHASSSKQSMVFEGVIAPVQGKGRLEAPTKFPCIVFMFSSSSGRPVLAFWAEKGDDIKISGKTSDPLSWEVTGNDLNEQWSRWRIDNRETLSVGDPKKINALVAGYVKAHPRDEFSTILLTLYYSRRDDEAGFASLWKSLDKDARPEDLMKAISRSDLLREPQAPGKLKDIIARGRRPSPDSLRRGLLPDTLRIASAKAVMLYFRDTSSEARVDIDSLRALAAQYPDSSSRLISEIFIEPDSLIWSRTVVEDTLRRAARCWIPAGLADPELIRIGVPRGRFFIVADRKGAQRYRGSDSGEALKTFRRLMSAEKSSEK